MRITIEDIRSGFIGDWMILRQSNGNLELEHLTTAERHTVKDPTWRSSPQWDTVQINAPMRSEFPGGLTKAPESDWYCPPTAPLPLTLMPESLRALSDAIWWRYWNNLDNSETDI